MTPEGALALIGALIGGIAFAYTKLSETDAQRKVRKQKTEEMKPVTNGNATKLRQEMAALSTQMSRLNTNVTDLAGKTEVLQGTIDYVRDLTEDNARAIREINKRDGEI